MKNPLTNNKINKFFIWVSLFIPFANIDYVFSSIFPDQFPSFSRYLLDSDLWPKFILLNFLLLFIIVRYFLIFKKQQYSIQVVKTPIFYLYAGFVLFNFLSIFHSQNTSLALTSSIKSLVFFLYFIWGYIVLSNNQIRPIHIGKALVIFALFASLIGVFQALSYDYDDQYFIKIHAVFSNKNLFSQILLFSLPFTIFTLIRSKKYWRWLSVITAWMQLSLIVLLFSRAVLLGLGVSLIVVMCLIFLFRKKYPIFSVSFRKIALIFSLASMIFLGIIYEYSKYETIRPANHQLPSLDNSPVGSAKERLLLWEATYDMILDNLLWGVGSGNWEIMFPKYSQIEIVGNTTTTYFNFKRAHNDYLQLAAEIGIIGIVLFLLLFIFTIVHIIYSISKAKLMEERLFLLSLLFALISYLIVSFFSFPKERISHSLLLNLFLVLTCSLYQNNRPLHYWKIKWLKPFTFFSLGIVFIAMCIGTINLRGEIHTTKAYRYRLQNNHFAVIKEINKANSFFYTMDLNGTPIKWYSATAWYMQKNIHKALFDYKESCKVHPYHIYSLNDLACCYVELGDYTSGKKFYRKALLVSPQFEESLVNLSIVYFNLGNTDSASFLIHQCDSSTSNIKYKEVKDALRQLEFKK